MFLTRALRVKYCTIHRNFCFSMAFVVVSILAYTVYGRIMFTPKEFEPWVVWTGPDAHCVLAFVPVQFVHTQAQYIISAVDDILQNRRCCRELDKRLVRYTDADIRGVNTYIRNLRLSWVKVGLRIFIFKLISAFSHGLLSLFITCKNSRRTFTFLSCDHKRMTLTFKLDFGGQDEPARQISRS